MCSWGKLFLYNPRSRHLKTQDSTGPNSCFNYFLNSFWVCGLWWGFFLWRWSFLMPELWTTFILVVPHNRVCDTFIVSLKSVLAYCRLCSAKMLEESMPLTLRKKILIKLLDFLSCIQPFSTRGWGRRRWTHCCSHSKRCI